MQVVQFIKEGNTLECPENTPKSVYKVMSTCWASSPGSRPSFRKLFADLDTIEGELVLIQKHINTSQRSTPQSPSKCFVWDLLKKCTLMNFKLMVYSDKNVRFCIVKLPMMQADDFKSRSATFSVIFIRFRQFLLS